VKEISEFPEAVELLQDYTIKGLCSPQLHGYEHINYGDDKEGNPEMTVVEILAHLEHSMEWFTDNLGFEPSIWATPWGARNDHMLEAAAMFDIKIETTEGIITPGEAVSQLRKGNSIDGCTIMDHWWKKGLNVLRLVEIIKAGSYELAAEARKDIFNEEKKR
jgi:peptidoglycan/xylan/chitin deacetylase (PgdA/CDA1 family)